MFAVFVNGATALALALALIASIWDIKTRTLPDSLSASIAVVALLGQIPVWIEGSGLKNLAGLLVTFLAFSLLLLIAIIRPADFGGGDVKFGTALVLTISLREPLLGVWALLLPFVIAGFFTVFGLLLGRLSRKSEIPFGPFQWLGALGAFAGGAWFGILP